MTDRFVHLHVASAFSMRYGSTMPERLVERAAQDGQPALALTDRDGLYGAVRFVRAAQKAGVAPILGVDLALDGRSDDPTGRSRRSPARGGATVDPRRPRVVVLARGTDGGASPGAGWAALCRLVSHAHAHGGRGSPRAAADRLTSGPVTILLGPDSDIGRAVLHGRRDLAATLLRDWSALAPGRIVVEIVDAGSPPQMPGSRRQARAMLSLAEAEGIPSVLTAAVRYLEPRDGRIADILDATRRLVVLDPRHLDRTGDGGDLSGHAAMWARAHAVTGDSGRAEDLIRRTLQVARESIQDPRHDLGIGSVHLPEIEALGFPASTDAHQVLVQRTRAAVGWRYPHASPSTAAEVESRLDDELEVIRQLGYPTYFLTVASVVDLIRERGVRVAARGSGAGSLVNYLLGISGVDPIRYDLLMERFCSPLRAELPDIDIDVESARRTEIYQAVIDAFTPARVVAVSMMDTYRVRHAIRDVGAALGMPPGDIDEIAKAFPHIRARDARAAVADLPELRARGLSTATLSSFFDLVESLDGLPRHIAMHPCGVVLSGTGLLDRTPVERSGQDFPMSQFDKDDVEALGLLKLDILGIRMQSAMAYAVEEIRRVDGQDLDLDDQSQVPLDDEATFEMIRTTHTLGCFQIESPGQRELLGKFGPQRFEDLVIDISLFRPGPVKSDMITPFLNARHGWSRTAPIHASLVAALAETEGVVVFHEQVLRIVSVTTGVSLAQADEVRRAMGNPEGQQQIEQWWRSAAAARGYSPADRDRIWEVLRSFGSFGFCKAHAAAFALPTYHSAWLKTHYPAAFLAGVLTHDPGMYPKRLILDDARRLGIPILPLDVNVSGLSYRVEPIGDTQGIRIPVTEVAGMSEDEAARIVAGAPYADLADFWFRARVAQPVVERLIRAGAFDVVHGIDSSQNGTGTYGRVTRRDLALHLADLEGHRPRGSGNGQLALDLGDTPRLRSSVGLPDFTGVERVRAELDILGLDVSQHVVDSFRPLLVALRTTASREVVNARSGSTIWVAGAKVATQTPPIRSGRRVVFLTLDDGTGPVDTTFFEDVQGPYAETVFHSWLLLVRGIVRRTGDRGVSLRATGAWELTELWNAWSRGGLRAVHDELAAADDFAQRRAMAPTPQPDPRGRRVLVHASGFRQSPYADIAPAGPTRKLWHASPGSSGH